MKNFRNTALAIIAYGIPIISGYSPAAAAGTLLQQQHLNYEGAFRVPKGNLGGDSSYADTLARSGTGLTFNPVNNSLIMISRGSEKLAVEISIPIPKIEGSISNLNTAVMVQAPGNVANSQWDNLRLDNGAVGNGGTPGGLLVYNNKLIGSVYAYYDGPSEAARSHFTASLTWASSGSNFSGMHRVGVAPVGTANGGFVGGYMAHIPPEWQSAFGYPVLTGKGAIAVITRSSTGPCAWGFDPNELGKQDPANATFLVGYPDGHQTLGSYSSSAPPSLYYNQVTQLNGLVFPQGSDTLLFFGRHGLGLTGKGDSCYGTGTGDINLHGTLDSYGNVYCYDPVNSSKGEHGYPYINQVWAYKAQDLIDVKNGLKDPWDIIPYARWEIQLPFSQGLKVINGVAYDPSTQRIFIAQHESDTIYSVYEPYPLIHVFKINLVASPTPIIFDIK